MMAKVDGVQLPGYFEHYDTPVKLVATPDGGHAAWQLNRSTGGWLPADDILAEVTGAVGGETYMRSADRFVQHVEALRGRYLSGEGPVFALYETIRAIDEQAAAEDRDYTPQEAALIKGIRRRTFVMFEEQLQRAGDPGADPTIAAAGS
ncbi:hypothetical protein [Micromonospora sp. DT31]|uniref:hypothetical protein n=1 Tax=Micromonospora sp. DT31 TaxID=3393434 RepID=UPI003CF303EE